jgi:hypothetical protein
VDIQDNSSTGFTTFTYGSFYTTFPNAVPTQLGNYIIFYYVTDGAGNKSNVIARVISVVDPLAPVLTLTGVEMVEIERWKPYTDQGYTISDNYYPSNQLQVDTINQVNMLLPGTYLYCYQAKDPSGNKSPETCRLVRVVDPTSVNSDPVQGQVKVYPNPSDGRCIIMLSPGSGIPEKIVITNTLGQQLAEISELSVSNSQIHLDLTSLPPGLYTVKIDMGNHSVLTKMNIYR